VDVKLIRIKIIDMKKIKHLSIVWNKMSRHASSAQILCFLGYIGIFVLGFCYLCYKFIIANLW